MPHSCLSLLNFDILRWQLYRNGEASSQGLSEHDCHCGSRRRKARNAVEVSAAASGADTSTVFSDAAANDRTNTLETLEILEGAPEEFAGKSAFGVCKFCWNCATVVLLIIALVFAVTLLLDQTTILSSSEAFVSDSHSLPQLAVQVSSEYRDGYTRANKSTTSTVPYHYTIEVTHTVIPRADSEGRRSFKTYGSPGAQARPAYPDTVMHSLELCDSEALAMTPDGTLNWKDDFLATQIHTYYCLPSDLLVQGTYGSEYYKFIAVDVLALSIFSPETGVSLAMRSPLPGSSKKFARWESLYFNGQPGLPHTRHELFFSPVAATVENAASGLLPETLMPAVKLNYSVYSSQYSRQTAYQNSSRRVLTLYLRSAQKRIDKTWRAAGNIVSVTGALGGYYISITLINSFGLILSYWVMGAWRVSMRMRHLEKAKARLAQMKSRKTGTGDPDSHRQTFGMAGVSEGS